MEVPILLPDVGAENEPIWISCWLVEPGMEVVAGERILEIRIPGVTFDVSAPVTGILARIAKGPGQAAAVGEAVGWIEATEESERG